MDCPFCRDAMDEAERTRYSIIWECLKCGLELTLGGEDEAGNKKELNKGEEKGSHARNEALK